MPLFVQSLPNLALSTATTTGVALGVAGLGSAVSSPLLGRGGARLGYKRILAVCALGAGLASTGLALSRGLASLLLLQAAVGIFSGGLLPMAYTLVSVRTTLARQGAIYGLTSSISAMGMALGPLSAGLLAAAVGIRPTFVLAGLVLLLVALWTVIAVPGEKLETRN
jgi:DHA1 family multidrug resistance protein-like MFS transporter